MSQIYSERKKGNKMVVPFVSALSSVGRGTARSFRSPVRFASANKYTSCTTQLCTRMPSPKFVTSSIHPPPPHCVLASPPHSFLHANKYLPHPILFTSPTETRYRLCFWFFAFTLPSSFALCLFLSSRPLPPLLAPPFLFPFRLAAGCLP